MKKKLVEFLNYLIKGIYAGIMIGIAGCVYLSVENHVMGSFLFALGLLTICMYGMNLYTGKIGYVLINKATYLFELLFTLLGNFIGTFVVGKLILLTRFKSIGQAAKKIGMLKLNDNLLSIFILAFFCGILMYIAVNNHKKISGEIGKYIGIFLCVMVFILCGFEHSIANMFYFSAGSLWSFKTLLYVLVMVAGNSVGSILFAFFYNRFYKN
ncbi:MAG: formate/nitrite transporter family protein [Bacilli bacterium]|nr:formate/nitrite transporter family protein [Bacilli bacterium]